MYEYDYDIRQAIGQSKLTVKEMIHFHYDLDQPLFDIERIAYYCLVRSLLQQK
jgi:hypothetical protein